MATSSENSIRVRRAQTDDAAALMLVINAAFRQAEEFFIDEQRIDLEGLGDLLGKGTFLIAERAGRVLGCVYIEPRGERAYLGLLSVDPQNQQAGLGSRLMEEAERYCRNQACRMMDIKIVSLRTELSSFYRRRGYIKLRTSPFPPGVETKLPCHFIEMSKYL